MKAVQGCVMVLQLQVFLVVLHLIAIHGIHHLCKQLPMPPDFALELIRLMFLIITDVSVQQLLLLQPVQRLPVGLPFREQHVCH